MRSPAALRAVAVLFSCCFAAAEFLERAIEPGFAYVGSLQRFDEAGLASSSPVGAVIQVADDLNTSQTAAGIFTTEVIASHFPRTMQLLVKNWTTGEAQCDVFLAPQISSQHACFFTGDGDVLTINVGPNATSAPPSAIANCSLCAIYNLTKHQLVRGFAPVFGGRSVWTGSISQSNSALASRELALVNFQFRDSFFATTSAHFLVGEHDIYYYRAQTQAFALLARGGIVGPGSPSFTLALGRVVLSADNQSLELVIGPHELNPRQYELYDFNGPACSTVVCTRFLLNQRFDTTAFDARLHRFWVATDEVSGSSSSALWFHNPVPAAPYDPLSINGGPLTAEGSYAVQIEKQELVFYWEISPVTSQLKKLFFGSYEFRVDGALILTTTTMLENYSSTSSAPTSRTDCGTVMPKCERGIFFGTDVLADPALLGSWKGSTNRFNSHSLVFSPAAADYSWGFMAKDSNRDVYYSTVASRSEINFIRADVPFANNVEMGRYTVDGDNLILSVRIVGQGGRPLTASKEDCPTDTCIRYYLCPETAQECKEPVSAATGLTTRQASPLLFAGLCTTVYMALLH